MYQQHDAENQVRLKISGDVQGVLFRAGAREKADSLGISGWVKNEPDGTVSIYAAGAPQNLQTFIDWCKHGPPAARVDKVEIETGTEINITDATTKPASGFSANTGLPGGRNRPAAAPPSGFEIRY
jgi:acylphosphatase